MGSKLDASLAVLNGAIGDYLAKTRNGLATEMTFYTHTAAEGGAVVSLERGAFDAFSSLSGKLVVLVHGLMSTEAIWRMPDGNDYGTLLARDLAFTPLYVRYNSGLPLAETGVSLSRALESLVESYPVPIEEIVPIGYSMGGLVVRSACHEARLQGHRWLPLVRRAIYVGTPHRGAPLERVGRVITKVLRAVPDPYTRLVGEIADLRSIGLKDLGDGLRDPRHPVPLLPEIRHYLVAGSLSADPWLATLFGDALVPVASATDAWLHPRRTALPPSHVKVIGGLGHLALASDPAVYLSIRAWCDNAAIAPEEP